MLKVWYFRSIWLICIFICCRNCRGRKLIWSWLKNCCIRKLCYRKWNLWRRNWIIRFKNWLNFHRKNLKIMIIIKYLTLMPIRMRVIKNNRKIKNNNNRMKSRIRKILWIINLILEISGIVVMMTRNRINLKNMLLLNWFLLW